MNVLFIGQFAPRSLISQYGNQLDSLYRVSETLLDGFRSIDSISLNVLTIPDVASYRKSGIFHIKTKYFVSEKVKVVGFYNLPVLKTIIAVILTLYYSFLYIKRKPTNQQVYVIIPYMVFKHVFISRALKCFFPKKVKICIVVPDIFFPKKKIAHLINRMTESMAKKSDAFVLYTRAMADYLNLKEGQYKVFEGFMNLSIFPKIIHTHKNFVITYTGSLNKEYGILRLLESFNYIHNPNFQLRLYGNGNALDAIISKSKVDKRIIYCGRVSKSDALASLYNSSLLINPRSANDGQFVQYSFPSKDIEYLATGVPCVLCKLPGMPTSYYDYFEDAGSASPQELAHAIQKVYDFPTQAEERAKRAQQFIISRMDIKSQAQEIVKLMLNN